jgi:hypothetical protein
MDPNTLPPELAAKSFHGFTVLTILFMLHSAGQIAGRCLTALRSEGGLRGIFRAIYTGSATAEGNGNAGKDAGAPSPVPMRGGPGGTAVLLFVLLLFTGLIVTGCGTARLEQGGAYAPVDTNGVATAAPDYAFFAVDSGFDLAYSAVNSIFTFERQNRAVLWKISPEIKHTLDKVRPQAWGYAVQYAQARRAYLANPTPAGLTLLQTISAKVQQLGATVQVLVPQKTGTTAGPAPATANPQFSPVPGM